MVITKIELRKRMWLHHGFEEVEMNVYRALKGADALVLMTARREFRELDLQRAKERMRTPIMIDGRRVFESGAVRELGFVYRGGGASI